MLKSCRVHTTLPTADLARARGFYENTLGIPPKTELPSGIFYDCGEGTRFVLSETAGKPSGAHTQMAFIVEDIESEVEELKSRVRDVRDGAAESWRFGCRGGCQSACVGGLSLSIWAVNCVHRVNEGASSWRLRMILSRCPTSRWRWRRCAATLPEPRPVGSSFPAGPEPPRTRRSFRF